MSVNRARDDTFPPGALYRDWLLMAESWESREFMVDLPNGTYQVFTCFSDPGYWGGEAIRHTKRRIEAEGATAWSEDLGAARVTVSDLAGPGGVTIPAAACDVRVVRHLSARGFSAINYQIEPQQLRHFDTVDLPANITREFLVWVRVPTDAIGGEYRGTITL
ncbi:MAG: hypothetical protein ABIF71_13390 [Planctomycetota bacterium]